MDFSPIISSFAGTFVYFIPFLILAVLLKSAWFKGIFGEFIVNVSAKLMLDKNEYHLLKNVTLPTEDGTTQIDHVIVSVYGIFVVETKNMKGWIFGNPKHRTWTQKIYKHTSKFQNPLHQNYKHVKTLESLLGLINQQVHSVIVFVGDSTFKTKLPSNVTYGMGYVRYIKTKTERVLTPLEVEDIVVRIETGRLTPSFKTQREHVKHIKTIVTEKQNKTTCPKCGNEMVLREAKRGANIGKQFWGCSKFPKCRTVVNITS